MIKALLAEAADRNKKQTERCVGYLRAGQMAVDALHKEFEAIVMQAELCDPDNAAQVETLRTRLHAYLNTNVIRPELWKVIEGVHEGRGVLQQRVESIWNIAWTVQENEEVLAEFVRTIEELEGYVARLGYDYPSGIGLEMLVKLQELVERLHDRGRIEHGNERLTSADLRRIIADPQLTGPLKERRDLTGRIERTINRLLAIL